MKAIGNEIINASEEIYENSIRSFHGSEERFTSDELKPKIDRIIEIKSRLQEIRQELENITAYDPQLLDQLDRLTRFFLKEDIECSKERAERFMLDADKSIDKLTAAVPLSRVEKNCNEIEVIKNQIEYYISQIDAINGKVQLTPKETFTQLSDTIDWISRMGGLKQMRRDLEKIEAEEPELLEERTVPAKLAIQVFNSAADEKIELLCHTLIETIEKEIEDAFKSINSDKLVEDKEGLARIKSYLSDMWRQLENPSIYRPQFLEKIKFLKSEVKRCGSMIDERATGLKKSIG